MIRVALFCRCMTVDSRYRETIMKQLLIEFWLQMYNDAKTKELALKPLADQVAFCACFIFPPTVFGQWEEDLGGGLKLTGHSKMSIYIHVSVYVTASLSRVYAPLIP